MGDDGVDLRSADISVAQQLADRLDRHALRQRNGRGKGVARGVERHAFGDARGRGDLLQPLVAPAVGRQPEDAIARSGRKIAPEDRQRQCEKPHAHFGTGFATCEVDPCAVAALLDVVPRQTAEIDVGEPGEAAEQKGIAHELQGSGRKFEPDQLVDFAEGQIAAIDELAVELVSGEQIALEVALAAGQHEDMFQGDHIDPRRVFLVAALLDDIGMEAGEELFVELVEREVGPPVGGSDVALHVAADALVLIIGSLAPADAHHAPELFVVAVQS